MVAGKGRNRQAAAWLRQHYPDADVVRVTGGAARRHVTMTATGPFDLVIDLTSQPVGALRRLKDLLFQVRSGGTLVLSGVAPRPGESDTAGSAPAADTSATGTQVNEARSGARADGSPQQQAASRLAGFLAEVERARGGGVLAVAKGTPRTAVDVSAVATYTSGIERVGDDLLLHSTVEGALAKLDEPQFTAYLERRPDEGMSIRHRIQSRPFTAAGELRRGDDPEPVEPEHYHPPDLVLRRIGDALIAPGQVVTRDRLLLPDSFRHNASSRLYNEHVVELAPRFAALHPMPAEPTVLAGDWFYLDNEFRGHFGHLITESLSRVWAWPLAKQLAPDLKVVVGTSSRPQISSWEYRLYQAAGIPAEDVVMITEPARVERLWSSTPMLSHPEYVHPAITDVWRRIGDHLAQDAEAIEHPERIFVSRRLNKRACHNTAEVEQLFRDRGFSVVFPEDYSLGDQVELFRQAKVVAGFSGSGVFQLCFTTEPKEVILVRSSAYSARNEYLFAALLGHRITELVSEPDEPSFQSPFTFDLQREGRELTAVFGRLGL